MSALAGSWQARSPRERRVIAVAAALVAVLLVATLVWLPLERTRARLAAELPALRASIAALEADAAEARRLKALPVAPSQAGSPLASLVTSGGGLAGARILVLDERRVQLDGADVSYGALLEWLGNARTTHGMRVESASLQALPSPGRVKAALVLVRA